MCAINNRKEISKISSPIHEKILEQFYFASIYGHRYVIWLFNMNFYVKYLNNSKNRFSADHAYNQFG